MPEFNEILDGEHKEIAITEGYELVGKPVLNDLIYLIGGKMTNLTDRPLAGVVADPDNAVGFITQLPSEKNGKVLKVVLFGQDIAYRKVRSASPHHATEWLMNASGSYGENK